MEEKIEVEEQTPVLFFIKVLTAFKGKDEIDYDALGIDAPITSNSFEPTYLNLSRIESVFANSTGGLNYVLSSGDYFSGRPEDTEAIRAVLDVLSMSIEDTSKEV